MILFRSSTFSIPKAFNRPGVYIFNLSQGALGEAAAQILGRLILAQLQAAAFKRDRDGLTEEKVPTNNYVLVDECGLFVNKSTGKIAAEMRKYGLSLGLVQQYVGQDIEPELMRNLLTNTPLKFTGVGTAGTYERIAQAQQVERESFYGLKPRVFHVSRQGAPPFLASASADLAGNALRMTPSEWEEFKAGQLSRWYGSGEAKGVSVVLGADPEEYAHERPLKRPTEAVPPPVAPPPPSSTVHSVFAAMRRCMRC